MNTSAIHTSQKLFRVVDGFLKHPKWTNVDREVLTEIFLKNLSEMMQLSFDISLDIEKLKAFSNESGKEPTIEQIAVFLAETLNNDNSYTILNHFLYTFIKTCVHVAPESQCQAIDRYIKVLGLTTKEFQSIPAVYKTLVSKNNAETPVTANP